MIFLAKSKNFLGIPSFIWLGEEFSSKMAQHQCTPDAVGLNVMELIPALFDINPFTLRVALRGIVCFFHTFENN